MPHSFFEDYDPCDICHKDHKYDYEAALNFHKQFLIQKYRSKLIMEQGNVVKVEEFRLPIDRSAFAYALMAVAVVVGAVLGVYCAW